MASLIRRESRGLSLVGPASESSAAVERAPTLEYCPSEFGNSHRKVKEDIRLTIFMLDLAVNQAGRIAAVTSDPQLKNKIQDCLLSVAELLELARQKAIDL